MRRQLETKNQSLYSGAQLNTTKVQNKIKKTETRSRSKTKMAVKMSDEQFQQLMARMMNARVNSGSFSKCTARFNGSRSAAKVDEFIQTIKCYKNIENISEENAIQGFPLLLEDFASTWWKGIQHEAKTFDDAIRLVRKHFAPVMPDYKIYMEIFESTQQVNVPTDTFVCEKRSLFSQLAEPRPSESMQLGMIFGLLNIDIRKDIKRESIRSFSDLLQKAREVELIQTERKHSQQTQALQSHRKRCDVCQRTGHEESECRKKGTLQTKNPTAERLNQKPQTTNQQQI